YKLYTTKQMTITKTKQKEQTVVVTQKPSRTSIIGTPITQSVPVKTNKNPKLQTPLQPQKKSTVKPSPIVTSTQPSEIPLSNLVKFTNNQTTQPFRDNTTQL